VVPLPGAGQRDGGGSYYYHYRRSGYYGDGDGKDKKQADERSAGEESFKALIERMRRR